MEWEKFFEGVVDFRLDRKKLHSLSDILMLSLCGAISGANDYEEIEAYGRQKEAFLRSFLKLENGIPSHDTINRVFNRLDKDQFGACLYRWSAELLAFMDHYQIGIDGKVLRGTGKSGKKCSGICLVSAWVDEHRLVLGQQKTNEKSNEKTAIPQLLESLELKGALVSIDAIACNENVARIITGKEANYLLALKNNQKQLFEQVSEHMQHRKQVLDKAVWQDFGSGRIETRTCYVAHELALLDGLENWPGIKSVVMVVARREKDGKATEQVRYYLSSLKENAKAFNSYVRKHWDIENNLHWKLDVVFREDQSRTRTGNGAENMAILRKTALQVLHQHKDKHSIKNKRKMAGWNDEYLMTLIKNINF